MLTFADGRKLASQGGGRPGSCWVPWAYGAATTGLRSQGPSSPEPCTPCGLPQPSLGALSSLLPQPHLGLAHCRRQPGSLPTERSKPSAGMHGNPWTQGRAGCSLGHTDGWSGVWALPCSAWCHMSLPGLARGTQECNQVQFPPQGHTNTEPGDPAAPSCPLPAATCM